MAAVPAPEPTPAAWPVYRAGPAVWTARAPAVRAGSDPDAGATGASATSASATPSWPRAQRVGEIDVV